MSTRTKADLDDDLRNRFAFSLRWCEASFLPCPCLQAGLQRCLRGLPSPGKAGKRQMGQISADWVGTTLPFSSFREGRGKGRRKERDPFWCLNPVQMCARPPWFPRRCSGTAQLHSGALVKKTESDGVGPRWVLGFCVSHKLPGNVHAAGPRTTLRTAWTSSRNLG